MLNNDLSQQIKRNFPYKPTEEQENAVKSFAEFLFSPSADSVFLMKGYAGTGKTTLTSALVRTLDSLQRKVILLAPTGRAAKVFSGYAEHPAYTIHKKIYRQKVFSNETDNFVANQNLHRNTLFIVDEASMIANEGLSGGHFGSGRLLDDLVQYVYNGLGCRLMLIGDTAQRHRIIATDGVFSMDGNVAPMDKICELAEKYNALVMVDESHSAGVVGPTGHGVAEQFGVYDKIDIFTGTLGKAFGGAMGGFTTGKKEIIDMLRQRSRPYLFSNSVAPAIVGASLEMFRMLKESNALHDKLMSNVNYFRDKMIAAGFDIKPTQSAICAVMLYDAKLSQDFAARMQEEGIYVTGFYYPVVPKGQARIRVQLSAGHEQCHLDKAIQAFIKVGKELNVIK
jgi:tRNA A37 threonylcarbamoyladenosine biosynthesis protein TsaE